MFTGTTRYKIVLFFLLLLFPSSRGVWASFGSYGVHWTERSLKNERIIYAGIPPLVDGSSGIFGDFWWTIPLSLILNNSGITGIYEASQTIILEDGFQSGAEFTARIVPSSVTGVPAASGTGNPDIDKNWVISKQYDDNGNIIGESKQFFDNSGRALQSQSKVNYRKDPTTVYTHVFASQALRDAQGRDAAFTLAAPIDKSEFAYQPGFIRYGSGSTVYDYRHFDLYKPLGTEIDKVLNPDPVGNTIHGTLGWYYSDNNTWEPYTPSTRYPYSRQTFYKDGTGRIKSSGGSGEVFKMGSGHEGRSYVTPVVSELDHYLTVRNKYFSSIGEEPVSLQQNAIQSISRDANGRETVMVQDKSGNPLMAGRPGTELPVSNSVVLPIAYTYYLNGVDLGLYAKKLVVKGDDIRIYERMNDNVTYNLVYSGPASSYTSPSAIGVYKIESGSAFTVSFDVAVFGGADYTVCKDCPAELNGKSQCYFKLFMPGPVNIAGSTYYELYDMDGPETPVSFTSGNTLAAGYYKLVNKSTESVTLGYSNSYGDISYYFYNHLGQQIASVSPEGVKKLYGTGINNYATRNDVPFISWNEYDAQGRLVSSQSTDGGMSKLVYRKDGRIRFSQNALQQSTGRYSYTNYDWMGRPVESGEYQPDVTGIAFNDDLMAGSNPMRDILENVSIGGGLTTGTKREVLATTYDIPEASHGMAGYVQDAYQMRGAVSVTRKYGSVSGNPPYSNPTSATWYGYDEEGKVIWTIRHITGLGYKTTDFTYNALGQLIKRVYQKDIPAETFVHYYEYDPANLQLWNVYTNTIDNPATRQLQAHYIYYLHGPLKRVELSGDLQGMDYTYTLQGALKSINNSNAASDPGGDGAAGSPFKTDAFGMVLDYYPGDYVNGRPGIADIKGLNTSAQVPTESYAGNIKAMSWFSKKPASVLSGNPNAEQPTAYIYHYDDKYQFTESTWGTGLNFSYTPATLTATNHFKETIRHPSGGPGYDANGNILYLQRTDGNGTATDKFTYTYESEKNRLASVVQDNNGTPQTYATYSYDNLGQLQSETNTFGGLDKSKYIEYDVTGKVTAVFRDIGKTQKVVEYVYDELGQRLIKRSYSSTYALVENTYYVDGVTYTQPVTGGSPGTATAQEYEIDGGAGRIGVYYRPSNIYAYQLTDHLGNVRAVVAKSGGSLEVRMYTDYYPYGMVIRQGGSNDYRYEYQGQYAQKDKETDWNAFELRMYDSRIARWLSVDPKNEFFSPYMAMGNSPTTTTDPDGGSTDNFFRDKKNGGIFWSDNNADYSDASRYEDLGTSYIDGDFLVRGFSGVPGGGVRWIPLNITMDATSNRQWSNFYQKHDKSVPKSERWASGPGNSLVGNPLNGYYWGWNEAVKEDNAFWLSLMPLPKGLNLLKGAGRAGAAGSERVFWSGGEDVMNIATNYAKSTGKTTLGMTRAGQNLQTLITTRGIPWSEARPMWARLSTTYAKGAHGSVHFFGAENAGSIWMQFEKPILTNNGVKIISH